jgi:hypothetical protein
MFTPVQVSPGSVAMATTFSIPAASSRALSPMVKKQLAAFDKQYLGACRENIKVSVNYMCHYHL